MVNGTQNFAPHTFAGELLARRSGDMIPKTDEEPIVMDSLMMSDTSEFALPDFEQALASQQLYAAESDSDDSQIPLMFGAGKRIPRFRLERLERAEDDYDLTVRISFQHPVKTLEDGLETACYKIGSFAEFVVESIGKAHRKVQTKIGERKDTSGLSAITYTCAKVLIDLSNGGEVRGQRLDQLIDEQSSTLAEDPVFQTVRRHFSQDPEAFIEKFRKHEYASMLLQCHEASLAFLDAHGINRENSNE